MKTFIMLGRHGDILNILPAVEYEFTTKGYKPGVVAAKNFASILDGCNYLNKIVWDGHFNDPLHAINWVRRRYADKEIVNCSVHGVGYSFKRECSSFQRESWRFSGCPVAFGTLPLTFDNRSPEREKELLKLLDGRPLIITALSGHSSPINFAEPLRDYLTKSLPEYQVLDISGIRAERIYDLLGLYEKAEFLIATDSAPLHLANAVKGLEVISLITDGRTSWYRSSYRDNHIGRFLYSEIENNFLPILQTIKRELTLPETFVVTTHSKTPDAETKRRIDFAGATWEKEGFSHIHYYDAEGERNATQIGDKTPLPFVKDMIDHCCKFAKRDHDIIILINSDIAVIPGIKGWIYDAVRLNGAAFAHRRDFPKFRRPFISEGDILNGKWYPGSDCFAFSKKWWNENKDAFPDMIFGRETWDLVMRNMIKRSGGAEIHSAIYHESHDSYWWGNRDCAGNVYNRALATKWLADYAQPEYWDDWRFKREDLVYKYMEEPCVNGF